eukprot:gnl/TRDRNA2_/TRDRNA2_183559_c0_seq1.p1 gnl/TRDRNA2_/TRDRNA2_183559_c0~~gnl/TRDRNA2_/TRDRNA2_183559_c0_seq1.p1  ORF type:complete len:441 (+),score=59.80 gnl/TRDRNA2_/TRDRNA2_183559_c0_seq1:60-1382(+)
MPPSHSLAALLTAAFVSTAASLASALRFKNGPSFSRTMRRRDRPPNTVLHSFGPMRSSVVWSAGGWPSGDHEAKMEKMLRILHVTDPHVSLYNDDPLHTGRMFDAFSRVTDSTTGEATTPRNELLHLIRKAREENVDLIALGGDIVNYPSPRTVDWVLQQLREAAGGIPFVYTAGNHDWHLEASIEDDRYDSQRLPRLNSTLLPLISHSVTTAPQAFGPGAGLLYGSSRVKGVDILFVDNSNHQISEEQLHFVREILDDRSSEEVPAVLLMHMPLALPGMNLQPKDLCGHPEWGAFSDLLWHTEGRPRWPEAGNSKSTLEFIKLMQEHAAPSGRVAAMLTGHVHKEFDVKLLELVQQPESQTGLAWNQSALLCTPETSAGHCELTHPTILRQEEFRASAVLGEDMSMPVRARGGLQYTSLDAAEGGFRMLDIMRVGHPIL